MPFPRRRRRLKSIPTENIKNEILDKAKSIGYPNDIIKLANKLFEKTYNYDGSRIAKTVTCIYAAMLLKKYTCFMSRFEIEFNTCSTTIRNHLDKLMPSLSDKQIKIIKEQRIKNKHW